MVIQTANHHPRVTDNDPTKPSRTLTGRGFPPPPPLQHVYALRRLDFEGAGKESMVLSSPSPNRKPKLPNIGQTPADIRVRKQSGQGGEAAAQGGGAPNPNRNGGDDDDVGGKSSSGSGGDMDQVNLDDAIPQTPAATASKTGEEKKGDSAMPN